MINEKIVLASQSPRRKELISLIADDVVIRPADCDESLPDGIYPREAVEYLSKIKNEAAREISERDEIVISAFWPPMLDFVNDTQFKYMQDAHIDLMEYGSDPIFNDPDSVEKMLDLCDKYDIYVTIYDNDAKGWTDLTDEEIQKIIDFINCGN